MHPHAYLKNSFGRAAITPRIVQHPLSHSEGIYNLGDETVTGWRQRKQSGQPGPVENEGAGRQFGERGILQVIIEKCLNPVVSRTKIIRKKTIDFPLVRE
jgi:hypothetical protein